MKLIFGLGNPGSDYTGTRHNVGFMMVDALAREHKVAFAEKTKFRAYVAELSIDGEKVLLAKPTTYYNEVGLSARSLIDFYKLNPAEDVLVIHDDLALPLGAIRVRKKGSDAGNNGIKSLNTHIGLDYWRLRVGIHAPEHIGDDSGYVLGKFKSEEITLLKNKIVPENIEQIHAFLALTLEPKNITMQ